MKIEISTLKKYIKEGNVIESIDYELFSEYLNSENLEIEITPSEISQKLLKFIILNDSKLIYVLAKNYQGNDKNNFGAFDKHYFYQNIPKNSQRCYYIDE